MRAIAVLFGLIALGLCSLGSGQEPIWTGEPVIEPESMPAVEGNYESYPPSFGDDYFGMGFWDGSRGNEWWCQAWYLRVEALVLQRSNGTNSQVLVESAANAPLLSTDDLSFHFQPGISVLLGKRLSTVSAWEMSYFGAQQWNETRSIVSLNDLQLPGAIGSAADDFNNADVIAVTFQSQLHNVEINYLRDHAGLSWLAGFRYLNWAESLNFNAMDNDGDVSDYTLGTSNNLYGAQLGVRATHCLGWIDWELTSKGGIFGNDVVQQQTLTDADGTLQLRNTNVRQSGVSFVGDINLSAHCQLNRAWRLRGGYNVLWLTDLALVADQVDFTNGPLSGRSVDRQGTVFLNGLNIGLEAIW